MRTDGRRSLWLRLTAVVALLALVALFVVVGLDRADSIAAIVGTMVAVVSLFVSLSVPRGGADPAPPPAYPRPPAAPPTRITVTPVPDYEMLPVRAVRSHRGGRVLRPLLVSTTIVAILVGASVVVWANGRQSRSAASSDPSAATSSATPTPAATTPVAATRRPTPRPTPSRTTRPTHTSTVDVRAKNAALFAAKGLGKFADGWLAKVGSCSSNGPSTPYERDSGMVVGVFCPVMIGIYPSVSFRRYGTPAQALAAMICQKVAGAPADLNETKTDRPGSSGSRAGTYCEYNARNGDPPVDQTMDVGVCWTDATAPMLGEMSLQDQVSAGPTNLARLRSIWNSYA